MPLNGRLYGWKGVESCVQWFQKKKCSDCTNCISFDSTTPPAAWFLYGKHWHQNRFSRLCADWNKNTPRKHKTKQQNIFLKFMRNETHQRMHRWSLLWALSGMSWTQSILNLQVPWACHLVRMEDIKCQKPVLFWNLNADNHNPRAGAKTN